MKELMEIFQAVLEKNDNNNTNALVEKHNLVRILHKVAGTAEQHNLVILQ
jgi:hypothetical protein